MAVLGVMYAHAFGVPRGTGGVDLFFVISGFIIARVSQDRSPLDFAKARFWRIYPIYLLAASPYIVWSVIYGPFEAPRIAATLSLWPIWAGNYQSPLLPVAWSLYFEILFYTAVTVWLFSKRAALIIAGACVILAIAQPSPATAFLLSPISLEFAAGFALTKVRKFPLAAVSLSVGLLLLFSPFRGFEGATMLEPSQAGLKLAMLGIPAVMVVYGALGLESLLSRRWAAPFVAIGDASYSLYLTHLIPLKLLDGSPPALTLIAALFVGFAFHHFVERKLSRLPRLARPHRQDPAQPMGASMVVGKLTRA